LYYYYHQNNMSSRFQVKIHTEDSIRRYSFDKPPSWRSFIEHLTTHLFPRALTSSISFRVEYRDDENDTITLDSEEEWQEMLKQKSNQLVQLYLKTSAAMISTVTELKPSPFSEKLVDLELKQSELLKQEELKKQELEVRKKVELNILEEELKKQEEIKRQVEEQKLQEEIKKQEEEELKKQEEIKRQLEEELRQEEIKKQEEKKKVEEEHRLLIEKLKLKEKEIREMEKLQQPTVASPSQPIPVPKPTAMANNNEYIRIYKEKLQKLWELGFKDVQRNLYLLITFNGDVEPVIEKLLSQ